VDFDDLVVGSGLAALGAVMGLLSSPLISRPSGRERRIGVLCGPSSNEFFYYNASRTVPCAFLGDGGLGSHWHGVIPTGWRHNFGGTDDASFAALFGQFYPQAVSRLKLGEPGFFVPWRAIRPAAELQKLANLHTDGRLTLIREAALDLNFNERGVSVSSSSGARSASRVWVAAGALHTPALLAKSLAPRAPRTLVSDHAFCYIGQVDGQAAPRIVRTGDGLLYPARYDVDNTALYTLRPAAFAFRRLDHGIEQRAVFGLPTGNAVAKITRRMSPGLLVEAFYNRFGFFGGTRMHSVYAQTPAIDAYELCLAGADGALLRPVDGRIRSATDAARAAQPFANLRMSQRPELAIPGIHLHHTLDLKALAEAGINTPDSPVQVVDASVLTNIGPDHHSFKMMLSAHARAANSARTS
jgi:hypothetical protein